MGSPRLGSPAPAKAGINRQLTAAGNTMHPQDLLRSCAHRMLRRLPFLQRSRALLGWPQRCSPTLDIVLSWLPRPFCSPAFPITPPCVAGLLVIGSRGGFSLKLFHSSFFTQAFFLSSFFHLGVSLEASVGGFTSGASSLGGFFSRGIVR